MSERNRRSVDVKHLQHLQFFPFAVEHDDRKGDDETAVEDESPLVDADDVKKIVAELIVELDDVEEARPGDAAEDGDQG